MKRKNWKQELYFNLVRIRKAEEEIAIRYAEQEMRCPVHLSVGQEATPVGVVAALAPEDEMVSTHRGHAHYLAKGGSLKGLLSELYGKQAGCARGQGGSMHLIDLSVGFLAATSIVGGTIPVGVGAAFANKLKKLDRIVVVCIGDTALEEGVFHESANFAALHRLPVFFCCENNRYSCFSPLENRQPVRPLTDIAQAHGMEAFTADGNNVYEVKEQLAPYIDKMRNGGGPVFGEFPTYRWLEHCGPNNDDNLNYRPPEEIAYWKDRDPIGVARQVLIKEDLWSEEWETQVNEAIMTEVRDAFTFAAETPEPLKSELGAYVYAE